MDIIKKELYKMSTFTKKKKKKKKKKKTQLPWDPQPYEKIEESLKLNPHFLKCTCVK